MPEKTKEIPQTQEAGTQKRISKEAKLKKIPQKKIPKESQPKKISKAAREDVSTAAPTLNPSLRVEKELPIEDLVKNAYTQTIIPRSALLETIREAEKLMKEGKIEVPFKPGQTSSIEIGNWMLEVERYSHESSHGPEKIERTTKIRITHKDASHPSFFSTTSIEDAIESEITDDKRVKGYVVQRPDDHSQSVLILACKDHLDFYIVNDKKKIEWAQLILNEDDIKRGRIDLKITKRPELAILGSREDSIGKYVAVAVFDEDVINKTTGTARLISLRIYPKPNKPFTPTSDFQVFRSISLATIDLAK